MNYILETNETISSNICRTCLMEGSSVKSLFSCEQIIDQKVPLCDMLMSCASVLVLHGDGLPENICFNCYQQVNTAYLFRKLCERSDATLRTCTNTGTLSSDHINVFTDHTENSKFDLTLENKTLCQQDEDEYKESNEGNEDGSFIVQETNYLNTDLDIKDRNKDNFSLDSFDTDGQEHGLFNCDQCSMRFNTKSFLSRHKSEHTKSSFSSKNPRNKSGILRKRNQPRHCDICNKTFRFHSTLERHKLIHTGEKPFLCNICGKSFAQMAYLKVHSFIHTGEKPYKCQTCERSFAAPGTLLTHIRRHTGERPYTCKICGKHFRQSGYLSSHIRTHTGEKPIECKVCNRRFSQSGRLNVHMRIHSGEKPYQCTLCSKTFAVKGTLKKHIRTHTGEKPYKCKICEHAFAQSGTLDTHMRIHKPKIGKVFPWT